jgi:E3 ubiquitin-protein ligase BAH
MQVHSSVNGRNFKTKLQAKHIDLLKSPWLIELIAFQINTRDSEHGHITEILPECSCDFTGSDTVITCTLPDSVKLEFSLTCPIYLVSSYSVGFFAVPRL